MSNQEAGEAWNVCMLVITDLVSFLRHLSTEDYSVNGWHWQESVRHHAMAVAW